MLGRILERRDFQLGFDFHDTNRIPSNGELGRTFAGPSVTPETALALTAVYACVTLIADAYAQLPGRVVRVVTDNDGRSRRLPVPQPVFVTNPNPAAGTNLEHKLMRLTSLLLRGNSYSLADRVQRDMPTLLTPLDPGRLRNVWRGEDGRRRYEFQGFDEPLVNWHDLSPRDRARMPSIIHQRALVRAGETLGMSPLEAGRQAIALGMAVEEFGARFFGDGATPSSALETDEDLDPVEARAIKKGWVDAHGSRSREPAILSGGLKWRQISISPEESQFIETRKLQSLDIAKLYRVPPHMVGDVDRSTSWGTGLEEQGLGFVSYTLGSWISREEDMYNSLLPRGQVYKTQVAALLRGRTSERFAAYAIGRSWGWLSVNDIRALEDQEPIDGGDVYLQPLAYADTEMAMKILLKGQGGGGDT